MIARRSREPTETDDKYQERLHRVNTWPEHYSIIEAKWIWRAQVVIEAMGLFRGMSESQCSELESAADYSFRPMDF